MQMKKMLQIHLFVRSLLNFQKKSPQMTARHSIVKLVSISLFI